MALKRNIIATFLTQFPVIIISVISGIIITRTIGAEGKGVYAIFRSNVELFTLFFGLNINMGLSYFISKKKYAFEKILGLGIISICIGSVIFLCFISSLYFFFVKNIFFPENFNSSFYFLYIIITFFTNSTNLLISSLFVGLKKFKIVNKIALVNSILTIISYTILYLNVNLYDSSNLIWVFSISTTILLINSSIWVFLYSRLIGKKPQFNLSKKFYTMFFSFVITGYASNLINLLNYRLDIWVLDYYMPLKDIGFYSLAVNVGQMLWMVTTPIVIVLQPYLNSPDESEKFKKFMLFARLNFTVVFILGIALFFLGKFLIPLLYGAEFIYSIAPLNILIIGIVFSAATKVFAVAVINSQKVKYNLYATIFGLVATLILDFTLIPKYGIIGASIASSFAYLVIFVSVFYFIHKKLNYPIRNYFIFTLNDFKKLIHL